MRPKALLTILKTVEPFKYLNSADLKTILSSGEVRTFKTGDIILKQGHPGDGLYVILEGATSVTVKLLGKRIIKLANLLPKNFFGEVNLLEQVPCTATVTALKKTHCYHLNKLCYDAFYFNMPTLRYDISHALMEIVISRQRNMQNDIQGFLSKIIQKRQAFFFNKSKGHIKKSRISTAFIKKLSYIYELPLFKKFTQQEVFQLLKHTKLIKAENRSELIKSGDKKSPCYFIISGAVLITKTYHRNTSKFAVHGPHTLFCPLSFMDDKKEFFNYNCCDDTLLLELSRQQFKQIYRKNRMLWYKCYDLLSRYIVLSQRQLNTQIIRLTSEQYESLKI